MIRVISGNIRRIRQYTSYSAIYVVFGNAARITTVYDEGGRHLCEQGAAELSGAADGLFLLFLQHPRPDGE